ncbi:MAG: hemolysin family protein [Bernardetiaceae bacterium]|jgi:CBS domain containing-hemolysin-like protein|nr:hemolysin family protein [Bernardetiaceae bacterium]
MSVAFVAITVSLIFSAFFSALELAFISANKLHITLQKKKGQIWANIVARFMERPSLFITSLLIGNTISLVVYGIFMAQVLDPQVQAFVENYLKLQGGTAEVLVLVLSSVLSTLLVLAVAEFLPKSISLINPLTLLVVFAVPLRLIYGLLYPFVYVIVSLTKLVIVRVLRLEYSENNPVFVLTDLDHYLNNLTQSEDETDVDTRIFSNALEFKSVRVRDCMIPRTELVAIDRREGLTGLQNRFVESGHTKVLVYDGTIDNMIGYCHCLDLFKKPTKIDQILNKLIFVPESMLANDLMLQLISDQKSLALVVDEFGGTKGIITIEDVMEEIFGEIEDEFDEVEEEVKWLDEHTLEVSARLEVDYLNEKYHLKLPEGEYGTLGGLILAIAEDIPQPQEVVETEHFAFTILSLQDDVRIDKVRLVLKSNDG